MAIIVEATEVEDDDIGEASRSGRRVLLLGHQEAGDLSSAGEQDGDGPLLQGVNQWQPIVRPSRLRSGHGAAFAPRRYLVRSPLPGAGA
jgi:hypothetical protein